MRLPIVAICHILGSCLSEFCWDTARWKHYKWLLSLLGHCYFSCVHLCVSVCVCNWWDALKSVLLIDLLCCSCCSQQPSCPHCLWWVMGNAQNATSVCWLSWFFIHGKSRLAVRRKVCCAPRNNILGCWWCWGRGSLGFNNRWKKKVSSQRSSFSLPETDLFNERTMELDAAASPDTEDEIKK